MGNGVKTGNWVLVRAVLPLSLSAEADAKALGDWPTSHNLSVWTGQSIRMDIGALGFVGRWGQRGQLLSSVAGRWVSECRSLGLPGGGRKAAVALGDAGWSSALTSTSTSAGRCHAFPGGG